MELDSDCELVEEADTSSGPRSSITSDRQASIQARLPDKMDSSTFRFNLYVEMMGVVWGRSQQYPDRIPLWPFTCTRVLCVCVCCVHSVWCVCVLCA